MKCNVNVKIIDGLVLKHCFNFTIPGDLGKSLVNLFSKIQIAFELASIFNLKKKCYNLSRM